MRIAIVGAHQAVVGGAETYLIFLLRALLERGHEVAFAFERAAPRAEEAVDRGLTSLVRWNLEVTDRAQFIEELRAFGPDVVFLQGADDESLDLAVAKSFCSVLFAHAFYGTCATGWRVHHLPSLRICERRFGAACIPINYLRGCGARNPLQLLKVYGDQSARAEVLHALAGLAVASEYMRDVYRLHGFEDRNMRVLPPPVAIEPDEHPPLPRADPRRVLFLGRLTSGKGGVRAVQAVARCQAAMRHRKLELTIAGEGPELEKCRRLAAELGIAAEFVGWVGPEKRMQLLRAADVLVVPSQWPEPFGMVGLEAASVGVPAVAYRAGGVVDWLRAGESGELAEGFGSVTLAAALERALRDEQHHARLARGAWQVARSFARERHVSELETFFAQVARSRDVKD